MLSPMARAKKTAGVQIAIELFELAEAMLRQRLQREGYSALRTEAEVIRWRNDRPGAPYGDAPGEPVPWPRPARR